MGDPSSVDDRLCVSPSCLRCVLGVSRLILSHSQHIQIFSPKSSPRNLLPEISYPKSSPQKVRPQKCILDVQFGCSDTHKCNRQTPGLVISTFIEI